MSGIQPALPHFTKDLFVDLSLIALKIQPR